jgi:hypothetical protein
MLITIGAAISICGIRRSTSPALWSTEVFRKVFCTTARSVPAFSYISSHACSNERENPTSVTNAPMPMPMPHSVSAVRRRRRQTFLHAKLTKESRIGRGLKNCGSSAKPSAYGDDVRMSTPKSSVHRLPRLAIQDIPSVRNL